MTKETKDNLFDLLGFVAAIAIILMIWAGGCNWINSQTAKHIQEVECDGQGK